MATLLVAHARGIVPVVDAPRPAVRALGTAVFVALALVVPVAAVAQTTPRGTFEQLQAQAADQVQERYARPLGRVAERRREQVLVLLRQLPPSPGTVLEAVRPAQARQAERIVARLEVLSTEAGITECRVRERVGRMQVEPGDLVRRPVGTVRLLVAPCVSLVEVAPEIPEVLGERLRTALLASTLVRVLDDPEAERRAEGAYLAGATGDFVTRQTSADEVLYPVLMQTPGKLVLNLEYYSVSRGRATDIDVVSAPLDDLVRSWLRAGRSRQGAPPGFRRLPSQSRPWQVVAMAEGPGGELVVVDPDSVHVLRFTFPGLRWRWAAPLGSRARKRREPWCVVVGTRELQMSGVAGELGNGVHLLSDERRPQTVLWPAGEDGTPQLRPAPAELEPALERLWTALRPQARREVRWWPAPNQLPAVVLPCFADLDGDAKLDVVWSSSESNLHIKLGSQRSARSFTGFGDVKAVAPARAAGGRSLLWLTDPVWHGESDRLHAAEIEGDELHLVWTSEPFEGTLSALATADLNADGTSDLVAAERLASGTRLHAFLAFGSGAAGGSGPAPAGGQP